MGPIKIIGTVGPASISTEILKQLKNEGLDSFRINLSHSNTKSIRDYCEALRSAGIQPSLDTQGAQVRIENLTRREFNEIGEEIIIADHHADIRGDKYDISINHREFFSQIEIGDEVKIGFDGLIVKIIEYSPTEYTVRAEVTHAGKIEINKALDISNKTIQLDPFTDFDINCLKKSREYGVKEIYISFCNTSKTICLAKEILLKNGWSAENTPPIIAKIESRQGLLNLREITHLADAILVDRGDLSRELKISMIPGIVNRIIETCLEMNKPCYVATNVLDSMMVDALPSRAEISDIYNLLNAGVSGFVLAAEMAIGKHPVESLQVIKYMSEVHFHQQMNTGIIPSPKESIHTIGEPLRSWI